MLPLALAAFLPLTGRCWRLPVSRRHVPALVILAVVLFSGLYHFAIPGDVRLTGRRPILRIFHVRREPAGAF